ncbi:hypothetical protein CDAR_300431 [Caerostris darwini]|uniref:Uncharacterized protein n=1 Tax=Caerostris darwini TaxID=1538125 RepID=A0AAV4W4N7_9ARAC|nr:hypothetical protein CDAR_300431 [Caerostris darwini]
MRIGFKHPITPYMSFYDDCNRAERICFQRSYSFGENVEFSLKTLAFSPFNSGKLQENDVLAIKCSGRDPDLKILRMGFEHLVSITLNKAVAQSE